MSGCRIVTNVFFGPIMSVAFGCRVLTFQIKRVLGSGDVVLSGPKFGRLVRDNAKGFFFREFFAVMRRRRIDVAERRRNGRF
jgi:hypothetical protein